MKKIICLYGGPGSGKSTTCAGLYYKLKLKGFNVEMNREYIKEWVWEDREVKEGDQTYFFSKQARRERIYIKNGLDFIITDSPLILTHFYGLENDPYEVKYNTSKIMLEHHHGFCKDNGYKTEHFFINRAKPYTESGRYQTSDQAKDCDVKIKNMMDSFLHGYYNIDGDEFCVDTILGEIL